MNIIPVNDKLARWDPFDDVSTLYDQVSGLFNGNKGFPAEARWSPAMDIVEKEKEILIRLDTPGMERKDLKVAIDEGMLVISGERKYEQKDDKDSYHRLERGYGTFMRSFRLPDYVDQNGIKAECKDGVLKVHLAKSPEKKKEVKSIDIK